MIKNTEIIRYIDHDGCIQIPSFVRKFCGIEFGNWIEFHIDTETGNIILHKLKQEEME